MSGQSRPVALVTGATQYTGFSTAKLFAQRGFDVCVTSRSLEKAEDAAQEAAQAAQAETAQQPEAAPQQDDPAAQLAALQAKLDQEHDAYLRLAAEYDNFRKRSQKEKDSLYQDAKTDTVSKILPVFDNLERAVNQPTEDEAYKKGVEMTMNQLKTVLEKLGITEIEALGQPFDPALHNAVMHIEDENFGENTVAEVFQAGFRLGDKVVRFAMVKVAN